MFKTIKRFFKPACSCYGCSYTRRNGGYMPCGCKPKSKIDNTDLNNLLQKAIEAKPEFIEPPPYKAEN